MIDRRHVMMLVTKTDKGLHRYAQITGGGVPEDLGRPLSG